MIDYYNVEVEVWRAVPGWPGYEVSNLGDVGSLWVKNPQVGHYIGSKRKLLSQAHRGKYKTVGLSKGGKTKTLSVHKLLLTAFKGAPEKGFQARHLDGNPSNNRLDNLLWGTSKENAADRKRHGTVPLGRKHS